MISPEVVLRITPEVRRKKAEIFPGPSQLQKKRSTSDGIYRPLPKVFSKFDDESFKFGVQLRGPGPVQTPAEIKYIFMWDCQS